MTEPIFTKEGLEDIQRQYVSTPNRATLREFRLAAFALTLMEERDEARSLKVPPSVDELLLAQMEAKVAIIERDEARRELAEAEEAIIKAYSMMDKGPNWLLFKRMPAVRRARERRP